MPAAEVHLEPVGLLQPEDVDRELVRFVERSRGEHDVAEPDAVGVESARHQRRVERRRRIGEPGHDLDAHTPRRHRRDQPVDAAMPRTPAASPSTTFDAGGTDPVRPVASNAASSTASKPTNVASLASPASTISRWTLSSSRQVSVSGATASPGTSPMTSPKNGLSDGRFRHLDPQVGEFDVAVHVDNRTASQ